MFRTSDTALVTASHGYLHPASTPDFANIHDQQSDRLVNRGLCKQCPQLKATATIVDTINIQAHWKKALARLGPHKLKLIACNPNLIRPTLMTCRPCLTQHDQDQLNIQDKEDQRHACAIARLQRKCCSKKTARFWA